MKKIVSILFVLILCFTAVSCKNKKEEKPAEGIVVSYNGVGVSKEFFTQQVMKYKSSYLFGTGFTADSPDVWSGASKEAGLTVGQAIVQYSLEECAAMAWVVDWAKKNGITLTDEDKQLIEEDLATLASMYDTREEYLAFIEGLGFTEDEMRANTEFSLLYEKGMKAITAPGQKYQISERVKNAYFDSNYVAVKHIYINNAYELDENGSAVDISELTLASKNNRISQIQKSLEEGGEFDTLYALSDDAMQLQYPDGVILTSGDTTFVRYEDAALALELGEWTKFEEEGVGTFFIQRVEIPEDQKEERLDEVCEKLWPDVQALIWDEHKDEFLIDRDYVSSFDVTSLPIN